MKLIKFAIISLLTLIFATSCMSNYYPDKESIEKYIAERTIPENQVNAYVKKMDKEFTTPGFKGLHLGMSHNHVNELVKNTYWAYNLRYGQKEDNYGNEVWMGRKQYGPVDWTSIGCYGREGETYCHWIHGVLVKYYNDQVVHIGLNGVMLSADEIDRRVKDWGKFALNGLTEKYGPTTKIYKNIEKIGIFDFKSGYKVTVCRWNLGPNEIELTIDEGSSRFGYSVVYSNKEGRREVLKEESSGKHTF